MFYFDSEKVFWSKGMVYFWQIVIQILRKIEIAVATLAVYFAFVLALI